MPSIDLTRPVALPDRPGEKPVSHIEWARGVALSIARREGFGRKSQEADGVVSAAHVALCRCVKTFAPKPAYDLPESADGHFRGYAYMSVQGAALKEVATLRGKGDTEPLPDRLTVEGGGSDPEGDEAARRHADAEEEAEALIAGAGLSLAEEEALRALRGIGRESVEPFQAAREMGTTTAAVLKMESAALAKLRAAAGAGDAEPLTKAA